MINKFTAAVDLGSNSFRLQVGRLIDHQIYPLDGLKETVRLAAGLTPDKLLDEPSQQRALRALSIFSERLRGFSPDAVRAVATNTFRVAKNAAEFLQTAEATLGFPIEVISGREEARLIYLGVAHTLANPAQRQLVVDIGGGSTELIIGQNNEPLALESLYMGCVSYSLRFFPQGRVSKSSFRAAELAASQELQTLVNTYQSLGWDVAIGSSGTAKAIMELLLQNKLSEQGISRNGLSRLCAAWISAVHPSSMRMQG
ncbi:MAG TPA: Ppx/GppA family phosphatase, partial [Rugosibacter sp.]|nr:Ppx/GppA family phosphatase [Rugosibacter sp.]